jgi:hypothetical protein
MRQFAERRQQLPRIIARIVRLAADAEVALLQPIARRIEGGPQQVIPDGQEQAEVDVAAVP